MSKKVYGSPEVELFRLQTILTESIDQNATQGGSNLNEDGFGGPWLG